MDIININLPKIKTKEARINIVFNFGYLNENNSKFGLTHLVEHYLSISLEKEFDLKEVNGWINNKYSGFDITLYKKDLDSFLEKLSKGIFKDMSKNIDWNIIENEIDRIEVELENKYSKKEEDIEDKINNSFLKKSKRLLRERLDQIKNLRKFTKKEVQNCISNLDSVYCFVVVGYKGNKEDYNKFKRVIESDKSFSLKKGKKFKIKTDNKKVNNYVIGFITDVTIFSKELDIMSSLFLVNRVLDIFRKKTYEYGIYDVYRRGNFEDDFSYVWFHASSIKDIDGKRIEEDLYNSVKDFFDQKDLDKVLKDWKKEDLKVKSNYFKETEDKLDWVIDDLINRGEVVDIDNIEKALNKMDVKKLKSIAKKIFNKDNQIIISD